MENKSICILMATYNGSHYINNQLLSLQQQTYKNWMLYIHDDGSSDNTLDIIREFQERDSRIKLVEDGVTKLGPGKNFLSLVKYSNCDYTIFCDQDDIWLENKLSSMLSCAEEKNIGVSEFPSIVYADGYAFSSSSGEIDFHGISSNHAEHLKDFLFFNAGYQGCSIMFNQAMVNIVSHYRGDVHLHDDIVSLVAHSLGSVHFIPKKLMLYRQHADAVTGDKQFRNGLVSKLFSDIDYLLSRKHYFVKKSFYENYKSLLSDDIIKYYEAFFDFAECNSKVRQLWILAKYDFRLNNSRFKLLLKFLLRRTFSR